MPVLLTAALLAAGCGGSAASSAAPAATSPGAAPCGETLAALHELAVRVDVGVTLESYTELVGDAAVVRLGEDCPQAVDDALAAYQRGIATWQRCIASPSCTEAQLARDLQASWDRAAEAID